MAKSSIIKVTDLAVKIDETLTAYHRGINDGIAFESERAVTKLAELTRMTAPVGARGSFKRHIASGEVRRTKWAVTYAWYVRSPNYRLTHLLVHGHTTRNGGRTKTNPFLRNALDIVLPEYERGVQSVFDYYNNVANVDKKYHTRGTGV
jgi:hypothetical protein